MRKVAKGDQEATPKKPHDHERSITTVPEYPIILKSYSYQYTKTPQSYVRKVAKGDREAIPKPHLN